MDPVVIVGIIALAPVVVLTLFRVNAATAFLALCLGSVLGSFVAKDMISSLRGYIPPNSPFTESFITLMLLWLPVVLVVLFMARTIAPKQRMLNLVPALAVGLMGVLLSVPYLTPATQAFVQSHDAWRFVEEHQALVVGGGALVSILFLRLRRSGKDEAKQHK